MSETKDYIVDQAYKLFLSRSYEAVSISEISKAIGLTKGALYHHFTSKEELFKAVIDKYLPLETYFEPIDDISLKQYIELAVDTARKIVNGIFGEAPKFIPLSYVALFIDAFRHYPGFANDKNRLLQAEVEKIKGVLRNAIARGEIRSDINIDTTAMNFFSLSMGVAGNLIAENSPMVAVQMLNDQLYELYKLMKA